MKEFIKNNYAVVLAFTLPLVLIAVVAISTYLPSLFLSTDYDFIYSTCSDGNGSYSYYCGNTLQKYYTVTDGRLNSDYVDTLKDSDGDGITDVNEYSFRIFLHDTKKNISREISLDTARNLQLNGLLTSPDGVTVSSDYDGGSGFLFFSTGSSYGRYLTKGRSKAKLNLINDDDRYYYRENFRFIGWVLPGRNN